MAVYFFNTKPPRANVSQRCGYCALFEGCAPRSKNESGCTDLATMCELYHVYTTYPVLNHLLHQVATLWVRTPFNQIHMQTPSQMGSANQKKIPWRNYPILAVNLHWLAKSCSISVCLQAVPTYFDGVNSNLKPSTPKPTLVSLNHGHIHQPSGAQVLACSHIRKKCWHHQLSQESWATSTKAVGDAKHIFFPPVH